MPDPNLFSVLASPLLELEARIFAARPQIEHWFSNEWRNHTVPFYGSVDLRNSGFKLAPVDMNFFPGGFNNLSQASYPLAVQAVSTAIEQLAPHARRVLLVPENHTRNEFYQRNIKVIQHILEAAGLEVRLATLPADAAQSAKLSLANEAASLAIEPMQRTGNRIVLPDGFDPCIVLLNNDLSGGIPAILCGIEQPLFPPLHAGWAVRRKTCHFQAYDQVALAFAKLISIDPWGINPLFSHCDNLAFQTRQGEETLAHTVAVLLARIREKYREYGITQDPYVIVKANAGTYGMGVMSVKRPEDVLGLNRKARNKMSVVKEGLAVSEVIVQEGVYTNETVETAAAEPVIYMVNTHVIGGFYRIHPQRGNDENLNAPGMHFAPLSCEPTTLLSDLSTPAAKLSSRCYAYGVIARLSLLAASYELEVTAPTMS